MFPLLPSSFKFKPANNEEFRASLFFGTFMKKHPEAIRMIDRQYLQYWANDEQTIVFTIDPSKVNQHDLMHFVATVARFRSEGVSVEQLHDGTWCYNLMVRMTRFNETVGVPAESEVFSAS